MSIRIFSNYFHKFGVNSRVSHQKLQNLILSSNAQSARACTTNSVTVSAVPMLRKEKTSRAMRAYLERSQAHDEFLKTEQHEYQIGKRHLANMMGEDPETFTQADVDRAIEYLFPSGLFEKKARPFMKPPEEVFPPRKAAEFDEAGRPHHAFFYTGKPNFYKLMYDIVDKIEECNAFEDKMVRKRLLPDPMQQFDKLSSTWISKDKLEHMLVETIMDREYTQVIAALDRLMSLPYSYRAKELLEKYRRPLSRMAKQTEVPEVQYDDKGRAYITTYECLRKRARADVTVTSPGTGLIKINGQDITYFDDKQCREQLLFPLVFSNMVGKVDIVANVENGGPAGQAGAIRWGIAMGLRCFVEKEVIEKMRVAGLLQRDYRTKERKKYGQEGARRKFTWKAR